MVIAYSLYTLVRIYRSKKKKKIPHQFFDSTLKINLFCLGFLSYDSYSIGFRNYNCLHLQFNKNLQIMSPNNYPFLFTSKVRHVA